MGAIFNSTFNNAPKTYTMVGTAQSSSSIPFVTLPATTNSIYYIYIEYSSSQFSAQFAINPSDYLFNFHYSPCIIMANINNNWMVLANIAADITFSFYVSYKPNNQLYLLEGGSMPYYIYGVTFA